MNFFLYKDIIQTYLYVHRIEVIYNEFEHKNLLLDNNNITTFYFPDIWGPLYDTDEYYLYSDVNNYIIHAATFLLCTNDKKLYSKIKLTL